MLIPYTQPFQSNMSHIKKDFMKKITIIFSLLFLIISGILIFHSCSKDNDNNQCLVSGYVFGRSFEKCGCCPGWLVRTANDTLKFLEVPENSLLTDLVNFYGYPIPIKFSYLDDSGYCSEVYKIMTCIEFYLDKNCPKEGVIIGYDYTECACCGGWFIKVGQDSIMAGILPIESKVWEKVEISGFPIEVQLDYEDFNDSLICNDLYKKINCFTLK